MERSQTSESAAVLGSNNGGDVYKRQVERLMEVRIRLGMMKDYPSPYEDISYEVVECKEHVELSVEAVSYTHLAYEEDRDFWKEAAAASRAYLHSACPEKSFYPLSKDCVCHNMKLTTLMDVYNCVNGAGGEEIILPDDIRTCLLYTSRCV